MEDSQNTQQPANNEQQFQAPPKEKSGKGKKVALVILILALIAGAGFAGYTYASNQAQKEQDAKVAELQAQIDAAKAGQQTNTVEETATSQVLTIKEWGVVFPVDSGYTNLVYSIEKSEDGEMAHIVATDLVKTAKCADNKGEIGIISRHSSPPKAIDGSATDDGVKVGDYYYAWNSIQNVCNSKADLEQEYVAQMEAAVQAAKTVTKAE